MWESASWGQRAAMYGLGAIGLAVCGYVGASFLNKPKAVSYREVGAGSKIASALREVEKATDDEAVVHVTGAVNKPGVYTFKPDARVTHAIQRAGGKSVV